MIEVIKPGFFTLIQDNGRKGYRRFGIPECGSMDHYNATLANWLVNNPSDAALLELTIAGPKLLFNQKCKIAVTGADMTPMLNGDNIRLYESITIKTGDILSFGRLIHGCRSYLAVEGGLEGEYFLGSRSTYTLASMGGFEGRKLKAGDMLIIKNVHMNPEALRTVPEHLHTKFPMPWKIRFIEGPEFEYIDEESPMGIAEEFLVHQNSDRMGIRLSGFFGEVIEKEIISSPVNKGTIQLLPDNDLMILMNDGQVSGGYPRLGNVISTDLHLMAQVKPGDKISLMKVSREKAEFLNEFQHRLLLQYKS